MKKGKNIRVLIIDDDEDDFLLTADNLKVIPGRQFEIEWASSYQNGLLKIKECIHDVFIIDYYLGPQTGLTLIHEALKAQCEQPMILLTGIPNQEVDETAAELGAFDYLLKGSLSPDGLDRSIRYSMAQAAMIKAVKENEAKFRTIFEKARDMIFIADESGKLMSVSNSATSLTGYEIDELLEMNNRDLFADQEQAAIIEMLLAQTGEVAGRKVDLLTKNKEIRICNFYATMQSDRNGNRYCQGVLHDLTTKIREERVTVLSEKMEATGRLMRMLAHEVRNPLTNIGLAVEGFSGEFTIDTEMQEYIDIIKRNARRIDNLITQLLDSSKPTELKPEPASLHSVLEHTIEDAKDRLALKKIRVVTRFEADPDTVMLDVEKIKIAFTNIIVNAIEAMPENAGVLDISTQSVYNKLIIAITDNGCGISPDHINRLFEPYFTSKPTGMGLGLASTLNIIQSHGATVDVDSKIGMGTTFTLTFNTFTD